MTAQSGQLLSQTAPVAIQIHIGLRSIRSLALKPRKPSRARCGIADYPVVEQPLLGAGKDAEHSRLLVDQQVPKTTAGRVLAALYPAASHQRVEEIRHQPRLAQPFIIGAPTDSATIGVHV